MLVEPLLIQFPWRHSLGNEQATPSSFLAMQLPPEQYCPPHDTGAFAWHPPKPSHTCVITDVSSPLQVAVPHVSPECV